MKATDERKQFILDRLVHENRIYVSDLGHALDVSDVTIRKDLKDLEDQGLLRRVHGGATTLSDGRVSVESTFSELHSIHMPEKIAIAQAAYAEIKDGDAILLDASTTTYQLAKLIRNGDRINLTIITTAIHIAAELAPCEHLQVIQIGGVVRRSLLTAMGPMSTDALKSLHADKSFIGINGVDPLVGLTTQNLMECEIKRQIIASSTQSYVLADSSKMCHIALGVVTPVNQVDYIVTDSNISSAMQSMLTDCGVDLIVAKL